MEPRWLFSFAFAVVNICFFCISQRNDAAMSASVTRDEALELREEVRNATLLFFFFLFEADSFPLSVGPVCV
jgi:hypothetical protein